MNSRNSPCAAMCLATVHPLRFDEREAVERWTQERVSLLNALKRVQILSNWGIPAIIPTQWGWARMAPRVGLEPTTDRLTADCSTD